jgi:hypothetical protein
MTKKQTTRMGRPPVRDEDRLSKVITIRFRQSEYRELASDAATADRTVAEHLRECWRKTRV